MPRRFFSISLPPLALAGLLAGCADKAKQRPDGSPYETVSADPRRDSELASRENDRCLKALEKKDFPEAEAAGKRALDADIMFGPAHNNLGKAYFAQNKLYLAAWEFQYAAKLMPSQPEPKNNLGLVCESAGRLDEARDWFTQSLALGPDNYEVIGNNARVRVRQGDRGDETRDLLRKVALHDERPAWVNWARSRLVTLDAEPPTSRPSSRLE